MTTRPPRTARTPPTPPAPPAPPTTRSSRTGRTGPGGASRRDQLTAIAATLFARDGYHNVTVGDIAAAAGLSGPAIYRHFPGKQAILAEVVRSGFDEMATAVAADLADTTDPAQRLRTMYRDLAAFVIRRPEFGVMWRREYRHLAPEDAAELAKRMAEASEAAVVEVRRMRPALPAEDAELMAWAALSVLGSISDHRVRLPRAAFEELLAGVAMGVVSAEAMPYELDNRPQEILHEDRKERILAAAAQLFWDRGYHAVTLEEIGAAAGIAGPSIYSHFAGKPDLLRTITERIGERLRLTLDDESAAPDPEDDSGESDRLTGQSTAGLADDPGAAGPVPKQDRAAGHAFASPVSSSDRFDDSSAAARAALTALATRYVTTVLSSRDLVAAYFTEGHNLPERDRAETRRFQRAYTAHWAGLLAAACPERSAEEVRIRVLAAFAVVNDTARTRRLLEQPGLAGRLRALMVAVLLTPVSEARDVNRR